MTGDEWFRSDNFPEIIARFPNDEEMWRDRLRRLVGDLYDQNRMLEAERDRLRRALDWYADPATYQWVTERMMDNEGDPDIIKRLPSLVDAGQIARNALEAA